MTMQVHDELVFEIHQDIVDEVTSQASWNYEWCGWNKSNIGWQAGVGDNWELAN